MTLDHLILIVIGIGACIGLFRGFFREIVSTTGLMLAVIAANFVSPYARSYFNWFQSETISAALVWVITLILAMALLVRLAILLDKLMGAVQLGALNRLGGALVGALKYSVCVVLVLSLLEVLAAHASGLTRLQALLHDSQLAPYLHRVFDIIAPWASQHLLAPALELLK